MDIAQFGASGAVVVVVLAFLKFMRDERVRSDKREAILVKAINKNTKTVKAADSYLQQRNGRDIEHHKSTLKAVEEIPKTMQRIANDQSKALLKAVEIKEQHVEHQHVDNETVGRKK